MFKKEILVILDKKNLKLKKYFSNYKIIFFEDKKYYNEEEKEIKIENILIFSDFIFLFIDDLKEEAFLKNKLDNLKIKYFSADETISEKNIHKKYFKDLIKKHGLKTPIFEEKNGKLDDIFYNFPQPSIVFDSNYKKISKIETFQDLVKLNLKKENKYFIEEFLKGEIYWILFLDINKNNKLQFSGKQKKGEDVLENKEIEKEIYNDLNQIREKLWLKISLFKILKHKKRGWYFLDLIASNKIFRSKIFQELLKNNDLDFNQIIKKIIENN